MKSNYTSIDKPYIWDRFKKSGKLKGRLRKLTEKKHNEVIDQCLREISNAWTGVNGGVYVKGLGYLSIYRPPTKIPSSRLDNLLVTHGYMYLGHHDTSFKLGDTFGGFRIKDVSDKVRSRIFREIRGGTRYAVNTLFLKDYLKQRTHI